MRDLFKILKNKNISLRAKGMYCYISNRQQIYGSKHPFSITELQTFLKESKGQIYTALKELEDNNLLQRKQSNIGGCFGGMVYVLLNGDEDVRE